MTPSAQPTAPRLRAPATLEPVRFGEFLRDRNLISEEQWLAALADHWSAGGRLRIGEAIVARGYLTSAEVEAEARIFHDDLDVIEVAPPGAQRTPSSTIPVIRAPAARRARRASLV